jgi:hypothetical protein
MRLIKEEKSRKKRSADVGRKNHIGWGKRPGPTDREYKQFTNQRLSLIFILINDLNLFEMIDKYFQHFFSLLLVKIRRFFLELVR